MYKTNSKNKTSIKNIFKALVRALIPWQILTLGVDYTINKERSSKNRELVFLQMFQRENNRERRAVLSESTYPAKWFLNVFLKNFLVLSMAFEYFWKWKEQQSRKANI